MRYVDQPGTRLGWRGQFSNRNETLNAPYRMDMLYHRTSELVQIHADALPGLWFRSGSKMPFPPNFTLRGFGFYAEFAHKLCIFAAVLQNLRGGIEEGLENCFQREGSREGLAEFFQIRRRA